MTKTVSRLKIPTPCKTIFKRRPERKTWRTLRAKHVPYRFFFPSREHTRACFPSRLSVSALLRHRWSGVWASWHSGNYEMNVQDWDFVGKFACSWDTSWDFDHWSGKLTCLVWDFYDVYVSKTTFWKSGWCLDLLSHPGKWARKSNKVHCDPRV